MKLLVKIVQQGLAQLNNMKTFKFELTEDEANIILAGLQELPAKVCNPISKKLLEQAQTQLEPNVINHTITDGLGIKEQLA
jgi:hypothetical protein